MADLMPSTAIWSGNNFHPCELYAKNSPPLFYAKTTGATPLRVSLHVRDNGHTLILGPTGSGKSTLLNFIVAQHFRYQNATVFIFDKNKSSLPLCYACDGNFYDIGEENNTIYFQPLANLETDNDFDFAAIWLEELCKLNGLINFSDSHRQAIYKGLELMRNAVDKNRRTLSYFRHLVHDYDKSIANILDNFSHEQRTINNNKVNSGFIAKIFDSNKGDDALLLNNFNVFEMGKLMELGDKIIIPAIRYLIHIISKQFLSGQPTLLVFDESFIFFNHPLFRQKIIEWIKTVRKFNVAIIFATQELNDLFKFDELRSALKTNCATKIFLPNRKATTQDMFEQYKAMDLNDKQIELIANGVKGEYFYLSEMGSRKFSLELNNNDATYALVAKTSYQDIIKAKELYRQNKDLFTYNWLKYNQVNNEKCQKWLDLKKG
jgi:type IV secretory pathway VirB4 component